MGQGAHANGTRVYCQLLASIYIRRLLMRRFGAVKVYLHVKRINLAPLAVLLLCAVVAGGAYWFVYPG